jgi:transcription elongation factor GreA
VPVVTAASLFREVGLLPDGPLPLGRPVPARSSGVFIVELAAPLPAAPLELTRVGKWLERVPTLTLDGARPSSRALAARLGAFWLPSQVVLYVGTSGGSIGGRVAAMEATVLGDRRPASGGHWLKTLILPGTARLWWAATDAPEEYEDAVLAAFAEAVPAAERAALPDPDVVLPWANLRRPTGERRATGLAGSLLAEPAAAAPTQPGSPTRIVELPDGEADGARDEAKRGRRPAPGRGVGRIASAAAYAAQGSPRHAVDDAVRLSPEGLVRLEAELETLKARRPEVVARIATAREHGDLKENAEYHAAREEQGFLEGRIQALEQKLRVAEVVAPTERGALVELGSHVRVEVDGDETSLQVVGAAEADSRAGRISSASPVGAALMGRKVGDAVTIVTPGGEVRYRILAID